MLAFIRYPEKIDKDRKKRHAKHLQFFARALAKALDSRENVIKAVETLYIYMSKVAEKMAKDMPDDAMDKVAKRMEEMRKTFGDTELSDDDWKRIEDKIKKEELTRTGRKTTFGKLLPSDEDRRSFGSTCGSTEYNPPEGDEQKRMLGESLIDEIERLEDSDYTETKLGKSECLNARQTKITWQKAVPKERDNDIYKRDSKKMKPQTNLLKRKIQLYGNREVLTIRNQKRGRIDKRNLHRIPMDRLDIFKATITKEDKPLDVCLLVDESGSMGGGRIENARKTCISIKEALQENSMLNLWVMGHTADGDRWHSEPNTTNMTLYHSPKMKDRPYAVGAMHAKCENRDGNAILAAAAKVREETDAPMSNKLMIVFSDGSPAAIGYGGNSGIQHTAKAVKSCEAKGWSVISVGFGGAHYQERMFSNHIYINDIDNIANKVAKIIRRVIKV
jgi:nitric oxide reductase activation protein